MRKKGADVRILIALTISCTALTKAASRIRAANNTFFVDDAGRVRFTPFRTHPILRVLCFSHFNWCG